MASMSNEKLTFMGNSVLNTLLAKKLFSKFPDLPGKELTRLIDVNMDTEKLARVAVKHGLDRFLLHRDPLLAQQIEEFKQAILGCPLHSNGLIEVPKALANMIEAYIGAIFIDCGGLIDSEEEPKALDIVWKVVKPMLEQMIEPKDLKRNPMDELYETCQKRSMNVKFVEGSTTIVVFVDDRLVGRGEYKTHKEIGIKRAAKDALDNMEKVFGEI